MGSSVRWSFFSLVLCRVSAQSYQYTGKGPESDISVRWRPVGQEWLGLWSARHCWNCSPSGWQRGWRCRRRRRQPLLWCCSGPPGTRVPEGCSLSEWGAHRKMRGSSRRTRRRGCPGGRHHPPAAPAVPDRRRGGASPSLCADRRSRSNEPCCSRCTSHWLSSRSSSSSGETVGRDKK